MRKLLLIAISLCYALQVLGQNESSEKRIESILQKMTLEEKIDASGGVNGCCDRLGRHENYRSRAGRLRHDCEKSERQK